MNSSIEADNALIENLRNEILQLNEEVEFLREANARHRNTIRVARTVVRALRDRLSIASANDEAFKDFCNEEIAEEVVEVPSGLLCATIVNPTV